MAGIGFLLKKVVDENRFSSDFKSRLFALVLSSGPWLFAVLTIAILSFISASFLKSEEIFAFRGIIVYIYAFSLISTSFFQLILTRFVSDRLYQREYKGLFPNLIGTMFLSGAFNFLISLCFIINSSCGMGIKLFFVLLFVCVGYQWVLMVYLSALRDYLLVTLSFVLGFTISFILAIAWGKSMGFTGYLAGFWVGQVAIVIFLLERIRREFQSLTFNIFEFFGFFFKYPILVFASLFYNLGLWIDKIIMWYSPYGTEIFHTFRSNYPYDTATFISLLTIIPALSVVFLHVETDFYEHLRRYLLTILNGGTFHEIEMERQSLAKKLHIDMLEIIKNQFFFTFVLFLMAPQIFTLLGWETDVIRWVFSLCLFGAFFQMLFLTVIIIFWYLELLKESLLCVTFFALSNGLLNIIFVYYTKITPGTGYFVSSFLSFVIALIILINRMKNLNYYMILNNPMPEPQPVMPAFSSKLENAAVSKSITNNV